MFVKIAPTTMQTFVAVAIVNQRHAQTTKVHKFIYIILIYRGKFNETVAMYSMWFYL